MTELELRLAHVAEIHVSIGFKSDLDCCSILLLSSFAPELWRPAVLQLWSWVAHKRVLHEWLSSTDCEPHPQRQPTSLSIPFHPKRRTWTGLQGDTLAPYLFLLLVDYILRRVYIPDNTHGLTISPCVGTRSHTSFTANAISDLDFADDSAILSHNHVDAQALLTAVEQEALPVSMKINW